MDCLSSPLECNPIRMSPFLLPSLLNAQSQEECLIYSRRSVNSCVIHEYLSERIKEWQIYVCQLLPDKSPLLLSVNRASEQTWESKIFFLFLCPGNSHIQIQVPRNANVIPTRLTKVPSSGLTSEKSTTSPMLQFRYFTFHNMCFGAVASNRLSGPEMLLKPSGYNHYLSNLAMQEM